MFSLYYVLLDYFFLVYRPLEKSAKDSGPQGLGRIVSMKQGTTTAYSLQSIEARGTLFVGPNTPVYEGMVIGECSRSGDLDVNPVTSKKTTNMRASGTDEAIRVSPPRSMTLEEMVCYMNDDEMIEVTPDAIRLRKQTLSSSKRVQLARGNKKHKGK